MRIQLADQRIFSFAVPPGDAATVHIDRGRVTHVTPPDDFTTPRVAAQVLASGQSQRFEMGATLRGEGLTEVTIEWESHKPLGDPAEPEPEPEPEPEE
jgi:hypothetical protein